MLVEYPLFGHAAYGRAVKRSEYLLPVLQRPMRRSEGP